MFGIMAKLFQHVRNGLPRRETHESDSIYMFQYYICLYRKNFAKFMYSRDFAKIYHNIAKSL